MKKKYKIKIDNSNYLKICQKLLDRGFVFSHYRLKTLTEIKEKVRDRNFYDWHYIIINHYDECSMKFTAGGSGWGLTNFELISAEDFFKIVDAGKF